MTTINLEGLSLTTISDYIFPSHTKSIDLDDNSLSDLSELPTNLQGIRISNNNLGLTGYMGETGITGSTGHFGHIDLSSFNQLIRLDGINCNIRCLYNIPSTLTAINLMHNNLTDVSCFSSCVKLRELILDNNSVSDISGLPVTLRKLSLNNNLLTALPDMSSYTLIGSLQVKNNPITSVGPLPKFLNELDLSGTQLTDFSSIGNTGIKLLNIKYSGKDLSTLGEAVSKFNVGGDIKEKNNLSYINIFYTDPTLYDTIPTFLTINTLENEWTQIALSDFSAKCSNNFIVKDNRVYYYGKKYILFDITAGMIMKGTNDFVRVVGIKNKKNETIIDHSNSIIIVNDISTEAKTLHLNFLFMLNTGDYFEIYMKTGNNNAVTIYSFNLMIKEITI